MRTMASTLSFPPPSPLIPLCLLSDPLLSGKELDESTGVGVDEAFPDEECGGSSPELDSNRLCSEELDDPITGGITEELDDSVGGGVAEELEDSVTGGGIIEELDDSVSGGGRVTEELDDSADGGVAEELDGSEMT